MNQDFATEQAEDFRPEVAQRTYGNFELTLKVNSLESQMEILSSQLKSTWERLEKLEGKAREDELEKLEGKEGENEKALGDSNS